MPFTPMEIVPGADFSILAKMGVKGPVEPCVPAVCVRIYLTSFASSRTGGKVLQSQVASVTRSRRLLLAICCATNILQRKEQVRESTTLPLQSQSSFPGTTQPTAKKSKENRDHRKQGIRRKQER